MPTSWPCRLTSGPPELPGLMEASVWMKFWKPTHRNAAAAHRRDDARGHRLAQAVGIAHRHHEVADLQLVAVRHRDGGQVAGRDADDRHVGVRIRAQELGFHGAAVTEGHRHAVGILDDVVVGQDQALLGIDDHARAQRALHALAWHVRDAEDAAEERVVGERPQRAGHPHGLAAVHADHRRVTCLSIGASDGTGWPPTAAGSVAATGMAAAGIACAGCWKVSWMAVAANPPNAAAAVRASRVGSGRIGRIGRIAAGREGLGLRMAAPGEACKGRPPFLNECAHRPLNPQ